MIDGEQLLIIFHVDDCKLSHVDPLMLTNIITKFDKVYTTIDKLTIR